MTFLFNTLLVSVTVVLHYEALKHLSTAIPRLPIESHIRVVIGVLGTLVAHVIEIWLFGLAYYWINKHPDLGYLTGNYDGSIMDSVYFSFTTYTTLGFGDIAPMGDVRFLVGIEALLGLVLITWSASFMFMEMTKYWQDRE